MVADLAREALVIEKLNAWDRNKLSRAGSYNALQSLALSVSSDKDVIGLSPNLLNALEQIDTSVAIMPLI